MNQGIYNKARQVVQRVAANKLHIGSLLALACLVGVGGSMAASRTFAATPGITHVILLLGQSNMVGKAIDYNSTLDPGDPRIIQYTAAGVLKPAIDPLGHPDPGTGGGPAMAFAREYLASLPAEDTILLIPASYGGTGFSTPDSNGKNMSWDISKSNTADNLYERSLTQLNQAILATTGTTQIDAALPNIGGTDALNHLPASTFQTYYDALIGGYRSRLNLPNLPFVLGPSRPDAIATNQYYRAINGVQIATPGRVANTGYIPGAVGVDFYKTTDTVHYNQVGNRAMGLQYAHALLGLRGVLPALSAPTGFSTSAPTGSTDLNVNWKLVSGATGYKVEYKTSAASAWTQFGTTAALLAHVPGLATTTSYNFRVTATDGSNYLGPAGTYTATTGSSSPSPTPAPTPSPTPTPTPAPSPVSYLGAVGAAAHRASGLRKLTDSYTGADIRVRRDSDNVEQDIGFSGDNLDTASLLTFAGSGSAYIKTWYDQSGNGRSLIQPVAASQARIVSGGTLDTVNGKPTAIFDGTSDYYTDSKVGLYSAGHASLSVVMKAATPAATVQLVNESSPSVTTSGWSSYRLLRSSTANHNFQITADNGTNIFAASAGALFNNITHVAYSVDSGSNVSTFLDGTNGLNGAYTRSAPLTVTNFSVGASVNKTVLGYYPGALSEFITWTSALSATQRQAGQANQKAYYTTP